ncbi:hypothetical protein NE237_017246 [Protea cynaroides]|uniref:WRKY domain-containing protein n=1 Tax=Protea cynaroides TaxID=273540 RepID=A0A9Q0QMQ0_9MAGN|nr:hypothetical protein NE237_017246 [Protea cynaroides]
MAISSFQPKDFLGNPNYPYPDYNHLLMDSLPEMSPGFDVSDYLVPEVGSEEDSTAGAGVDCYSQNSILPENSNFQSIGNSGNVTTASQLEVITTKKCKNGVKRMKGDMGSKINVFRTKSHLEIMDDGFKWRKYGKKQIKSSPYPRNYYRCKSEGCPVKKRVQREKEDSSYVMTTYEGSYKHKAETVTFIASPANLVEILTAVVILNGNVTICKVKIRLSMDLELGCVN